MKTLNLDEKNKILHADTPGKAKRLGKQITIRPKWEEIKIDIMYQIVLAKFSQNKRLKQDLLSTGKAELVEGNNWGILFGEYAMDVGEINSVKSL